MIGEFIPMSICSILLLYLPESPRSLFVFRDIKGVNSVLQYIANFNNATCNIQPIQREDTARSNEHDNCQQKSFVEQQQNTIDIIKTVFGRKYLAKTVEMSSLLLLGFCLHKFVL